MKLFIYKNKDKYCNVKTKLIHLSSVILKYISYGQF